MSSSSSKKITLATWDKKRFEVEEEVIIQSQLVKHLIEDECASCVIPLFNVHSDMLVKVIEYCKKHAYVTDSKDDVLILKTWDADFVNVDPSTLYDLLMAANYMVIRSLVDLICKHVANLVRGKSPEEIRRSLNITNNFTPEEEEQIRKENKWAFETSEEQEENRNENK